MSYSVTSQTTKALCDDPWSPVGDIIDNEWYQHIRLENGKPDLPAIVLLARIVYFYRPVVEVIRDGSGMVIKQNYKQKFVADLWQVTRRSFAEQYGFSERQVDKALSKLVSAGLIYKELRTLTVNGMKLTNVLYIGLNLPDLRKISSAPEFNSGRGATQKKRDLLHPEVIGHPGKRKTYTETSLETPLKQISKKQTPPSALNNVEDKKEIHLPDWLPLREWSAFLEMRKYIRQPATDYAKEQLINKLNSYREKGHDLAQILNNSTINNWRDFFEPKIEVEKNNEPQKTFKFGGCSIPENDPFFRKKRLAQDASTQSESNGATATHGPAEDATGQT